MIRRPAILAAPLLAALALAAPAAAQAPVPTLGLRFAPDDGVRYPEAQAIEGTLEQSGDPVPGQQVDVEVRSWPYTGAFAPVAAILTDAGGRVSLNRAFDRNHQVRLSAPAFGVTTAPAVAFTFPGNELTDDERRGGTVRLTQDYTVPPDVALEQPTLFYLGRRGAETAPYRTRAATRRVGPGRYRSRATIRVPRAYRGRFSYASCFRYNGGSGMGNPEIGCSSRRFRFDPKPTNATAAQSP